MNWIGALITVFAFYVCGIMLSHGQTEKLKTLESLLKLFTFMKLQIETKRLPLYQIFSEFEDGFLEEKGFLSVLRRQRNSNYAIWQEALELLVLENEPKNALLGFGESLGAVSLDTQLTNIESVCSFLKEHIDVLKTKLPEKQKSIKTVCLLMGLTAAIILL